jgi:hypothetical protein
MKDITRLRYKNYDWEQPFDPNEYRDPKAIRLLYENWLLATVELEEAQEQINGLKQQSANLDKSNTVLLTENRAYQKRKWLPFVLQFVAVISSGLGINYVTSPGGSQYGWILISISAILELIAFIAVKSEK